mmetsp:Transcript_26999/g.48075  ORF Transcript_26999/g.48075 Transcript_26999/m.48075 type:complete len:163 (-) Transcript_26999:1545-2033(-)
MSIVYLITVHFVVPRRWSYCECLISLLQPHPISNYNTTTQDHPNNNSNKKKTTRTTTTTRSKEVSMREDLVHSIKGSRDQSSEQTDSSLETRSRVMMHLLPSSTMSITCVSKREEWAATRLGASRWTSLLFKTLAQFALTHPWFATTPQVTSVPSSPNDTSI